MKGLERLVPSQERRAGLERQGRDGEASLLCLRLKRSKNGQS